MYKNRHYYIQPIHTSLVGARLGTGFCLYVVSFGCLFVWLVGWCTSHLPSSAVPLQLSVVVVVVVVVLFLLLLLLLLLLMAVTLRW